MILHDIDPVMNKRDTYSSPLLRIYGQVKTLTASGTGTIAENGNQPNCSTNTGRKPC